MLHFSCFYFVVLYFFFFFFKQKTEYEMRISDWSSDVCSSDLSAPFAANVEEQDQMPVAQRLACKACGRKAGAARLYPQFLAQFAHQRRLRRFPVLHLAAGKLPQPRHAAMRRALLHQDAAIGIDQRHGGHEKRKAGLADRKSTRLNSSH